MIKTQSHAGCHCIYNDGVTSTKSNFKFTVDHDVIWNLSNHTILT